MILGKDWLDNFRPMWVHWKCQILCFTLQGRRITLHGVKAITSVCKKVIATKLQGMLRRGALTHVVQIYEGKEATICALDEAVDPETVSSTLPGPIASLLERNISTCLGNQSHYHPDVHRIIRYHCYQVHNQ